nr:hypothetical protein [Gammaproteobacteria bacterium]
MTNKEIAEIILHRISKSPLKKGSYICHYLSRMRLADEIDDDEYVAFKELLWSYADQQALAEATKCPNLD